MLTSELSAQILGDQRRFPESYAMGEKVQDAQEKLVGLAGNTPGALPARQHHSPQMAATIITAAIMQVLA